MKVSAAIVVVQNAMKTTSYGAARTREGIALALNRFMRDTQCVQKSANVTLTANNANLSITGVAALADFRRERWAFGYVASEDVQVMETGRTNMLQLRRARPSTGIPKRIAWLTDTQALLWPTPASAYTLTMVYAQPLIDISTGDPDLNVPDEYLHECLWFGASAATEHTDPDALYGDKAWQRFLQFIQETRSRLTPVGEIVTDPDRETL